MMPVAVPDYVRFGPVNALRLFSQLTRYPSLERLLQPVGPGAGGARCPRPVDAAPHRGCARSVDWRRTTSRSCSIEGAAHAINFSHPGELAHVISAWLDGREIVDDPDQPGPHPGPADPAHLTPSYAPRGTPRCHRQGDDAAAAPGEGGAVGS